MEPEYKRILVKLSGEGLSGAKGFGIDMTRTKSLARQIADITQKGVQTAVVIGGGNFFRGAKNASEYMDRSVADQIGMMATVINALAIKSALEFFKVKAVVFSGLRVPDVCADYNFEAALRALNDNQVVIFAGGTGNPYFTTDSGAALRAVEMHCDVLLKATQVDGVYSADPRTNPDAKRYETISYDEVLNKKLNVMDMTAIAMLRDNNVPVLIFSQKEENAVLKAVCGKIKCTTIK